MCAAPIVSAVPTSADYECVVSNYIENLILVKYDVTMLRSIDTAPFSCQIQYRTSSLNCIVTGIDASFHKNRHHAAENPGGHTQHF
jgi:hypothetical protein